MNKLWTRRIVALTVTLCLMAGCVTFAAAAPAQPSDFDALKPLMDLVASAAYSAADEPEVVGDASTTLTPTFLSAFFNEGLTADPSLGISEAMLTDTAAQGAYLSKVFAAKAPALEALVKTQPISGYIGFQPVTVNAGSDSDVQIIGELYWGTKAMAQMSEADYREVQWLDRAVYSFRADANGFNGYRLTGFSVGSELDMEAAMQTYTDSILVEYINSALGFSLLYPSVFDDELLVEDGDGVSAKLPDGSVSFFARRTQNASNANLADYVSVIAGGIQNAKSTINDTFNYATLTYDTEEGYTVFDVYIVTDKFIYQAELSYKKELASTYQMYTAYLENSFAVDEVSVG